MSATPKPNDPAMDEILASIRKIIADEEPLAARGPSDGGDEEAVRGEEVSVPADAPVSAARLLDAAALQRVEAEVAAQVAADVGGQAPPRLAAAEGRMRTTRLGTAEAGAARTELPPRLGPEAQRRRDLVSPAVDAAVTAAFDRLGAAVLPTRERTVEDLMKDILRPMLKTWLDAHLPAMVEKLVQQEIERLSRNGR